MSKKIEGKMVDKIIRLVKKRGGWVFVYPASATYGLPDVMGVYRGFFLAFEAKREDGTGVATDLQKETIDYLASLGAKALIVDDIKQVQRALDEVDNLWDNIFVHV